MDDSKIRIVLEEETRERIRSKIKNDDPTLPNVPMESLLAADSSIMHKNGLTKQVKAKRSR